MARNHENQQIYKLLGGLFLVLIVTLGAFNLLTAPGVGVIHNRRVIAKKATDNFSLVTLNVAGRRIFVAERIPVLLQRLGQTNADFIALQEVKSWFLKALMREPWVNDYFFTTLETRTPDGKLLLLSRYPIERARYYKLPSKTSRHFLYAQLEWGNIPLQIAVVHLDSLLELGPMRVKQMKKVFKVIKKGHAALVVGDFNFGDGEQPDTAALPRNFRDPWLELQKGQVGFTWNREKNPMAYKKSLPGEPSRRLDRILYRADEFKAVSTKIVFNRPAAGREVFPSDHFGVFATFKLKSKPKVQ